MSNLARMAGDAGKRKIIRLGDVDRNSFVKFSVTMATSVGAIRRTLTILDVELLPAVLEAVRSGGHLFGACNGEICIDIDGFDVRSELSGI